MVVKGTGGGGEITKSLACLETAQSELEPGTCPAWHPRPWSLFQKTPLFYLETPFFNAKYSVPVCRKRLYIWEDWRGKIKKGRQGRFKEMRPTPCWGILKCHPGLQREKQSKRKNKLLVRGNTLPCQTQLELIHNTTSWRGKHCFKLRVSSLKATDWKTTGS